DTCLLQLAKRGKERRVFIRPVTATNARFFKPQVPQATNVVPDVAPFTFTAQQAPPGMRGKELSQVGATVADHFTASPCAGRLVLIKYCHMGQRQHPRDRSWRRRRRQLCTDRTTTQTAQYEATNTFPRRQRTHRRQ